MAVQIRRRNGGEREAFSTDRPLPLPSQTYLANTLSALLLSRIQSAKITLRCGSFSREIRQWSELRGSSEHTLELPDFLLWLTLMDFSECKRIYLIVHDQSISPYYVHICTYIYMCCVFKSNEYLQPHKKLLKK